MGDVGDPFFDDADSRLDVLWFENPFQSIVVPIAWRDHVSLFTPRHSLTESVRPCYLVSPPHSLQ